MDLLPEDSAELDAAADKNGLDIIRLIATGTSEKRVEMILSKASGFAYVVSITGTTGVRKEIPKAAFDTIGRISGKSKGKGSWWISLANWSRTSLRRLVTSTFCFFKE